MTMQEDNKTSIDKYEVRPDDPIEQDQVIVQAKAGYGWADLFSLGNISTIIGKAKSRKTFFVVLLIADIIANRSIQVKANYKGKIVLFDTEQGRFHVWKLTKRIEKMIGIYPDKLKVFGLRPLSTQERITAIENYLYQNDVQLVFIDGIRDLVTDINSAEQATDIVGKLMKWSYERECHICSVLHQNKADENARGHIGTEIVNKSETVISVNKTKEGQFSLVQSVYTRGIEMAEFMFSIENGVPVIEGQEVLESYYEKQEETPF